MGTGSEGKALDCLMTSAFRLGTSFWIGERALEGAPNADEGPSSKILSGVSA